MIEELLAAVDHYEKEGARRFSRWNGALYRAFIEGPGDRLFHALTGGAVTGALRDAGGAAVVFEAYLRLVVEAIGHGYVDAACLESSAAQSTNTDTDTNTPVNTSANTKNLVALLLVDRFPALIPRAPAGERVALLAKAWNLAEGLLGEPAWLNRAVSAALVGIDSLADLDRRLVRVLEAVMVPRGRASLTGPFTVRTVDTRAIDHAFLPGSMHFSAPAMLCIHDRRRQAVHAGLLLGPKGASGLLGPGPCLGRPETEDTDLPTVTLIPGGLRVGDSKIPLSLFTRGFSAAASRAGYLVASALDSQRLWVVESP